MTLIKKFKLTKPSKQRNQMGKKPTGRKKNKGDQTKYNVELNDK